MYSFVVIQAHGGDGDDTLDTGQFCTASLWMFGDAGNDVVSAAEADFASYLSGGPGMDTVHGSDYDDVLIGGPGFDALDGGDGDDDCDVDPGELAVSCETTS